MRPGPKRSPFSVRLVDGLVVTCWWYRFIDQPSFQRYKWSEQKKAKSQAFVEKLHATRRTDHDHMAPPTLPVATKFLPRRARKHWAETQTTIVKYLSAAPLFSTFWFRLAGGRCVILP